MGTDDMSRPSMTWKEFERLQGKAARQRGPTTRRASPEHAAQVAVVTWATLARAEFPELALLFAIPNGGQRNVIVAKKLKAEGVKAGVPDLMLPVARGGWHGLFIEMKAEGRRKAEGGRRKGVVSAAQADWHVRLEGQGYKVAVCHGSERAEAVLREYLTLGRKGAETRGGMGHE